MRQKKRYGVFFIVAIGCLLGIFLCGGKQVNANACLGKEYDDTYGYSTLPGHLKQCYVKISEEMERFHNSNIDAEYKDGRFVGAKVDIARWNITVEELNKVMFAINADHPRYFWYEGTSYTYGTAKRSQKVNMPKGRVSHIEVVVSKDDAIGKQRRNRNQQLYEAVSNYRAGIDLLKRRNSTELEKERFLHDTLIQRIRYGEGKSDDENTVVGAFVSQTARCEGYAKAFQLLANYAGLTSVYAVGYGYDEGHAWNLVRIKGNWYNVDVTWDDLGSEASYRYFNCLDDVFLVSHAYSKEFAGMYPVPAISKKKTYEYYEYHNLNLVTADYKSKTAFSNKVVKAVTSVNSEDGYVLQFQVREQDSKTFLKMWKENEATIEKRMKKNGVFYDFVSPRYTEVLVTTKNQVVFTYEVAIRKYTVVLKDDRISVETPAYAMYVEQKGRKKSQVTSGVTSQYKDGRLTVSFKGSVVGTYKVAVKRFTVGRIGVRTYCGLRWEPSPSVYIGKTRLKRNVDYKLTYQNNLEVGQAKVTITGIGKYSGRKTISFTIRKRTIGSCNISFVRRQQFTGKAVRPKVIITYNGKILRNNKDYALTYYNNLKKGTGMIMIRGINKNFTGRKILRFQIL